MKPSEGKYYQTALLMQEVLFRLLEKKDFPYITVKELCKVAGVHRSTFYLRYDTMEDLLVETRDETFRKFQESFEHIEKDYLLKVQTASIEECNPITMRFLLPYLNFIRDHQLIFRVCSKRDYFMDGRGLLEEREKEVFFPIFRRNGILEEQLEYVGSFFLGGMVSIIRKWVDKGCIESPAVIAEIIIFLVVRK